MEYAIATLIVIVLILAIFFLWKRNKKSIAKERSIETGVAVTVEKNEVRDSEINQLWDIVPYNTTKIDSNPGKSLALTEQLKDQIGNVVKLTPAALDLVRVEKKIVIKFNEEVMKKLRSGELALMAKKGSDNGLRTIAIDSQNKIRGNGWLEAVDVKKVNPAQLANLAFGVMTIVTSQEHLDRINKQLSTLNNKVESLLQKYNNDKFGFIYGNIRYLKSILPSILQQDHTSKTYLNKIEDISSESYTQLESVMRELKSLLPRISEFNNTKFKLDGNIDGLIELYLDFEEQLTIGYGTLEVISICLELGKNLGIAEDVGKNKLADIEYYFANLNELNSSFETAISDKNKELGAKFRRTKTIENKKTKLYQQYEHHIQNFKTNKESSEQHIKLLKKEDSPLLNEPLNLQVEYDEYDNVVAVHRV